ncbi:MAG: hypothetical protein WCO60_17205 [Verrucomicrobiota bacterium]
MSDEQATEPRFLPARRFTSRNAGAALRELQTSCRNDDEGPDFSSDETERFHRDSQSLVSWAQKNGWLWSLEEFEEEIDQHDYRYVDGGSEHNVFLFSDLGIVFKITKPSSFGQQGTVCLYVSNIHWSNELLGDDIRFEGVINGEEGVSIVTSQPFVCGEHPELNEISQWFENQGYLRVGYNKWSNPVTGVVIADSHSGNFVKLDTGTLIPIDLQILDSGRFGK